MYTVEGVGIGERRQFVDTVGKIPPGKVVAVTLQSEDNWRNVEISGVGFVEREEKGSK